MAFTFTADSVLASRAGRQVGVAGEALTAGLFVYQNGDGLLFRASSAAAPSAAVRGITLSAAAIGQPVVYSTGGPIQVQDDAFDGEGELLVLSTAGKCQTHADIDAEVLTIIGWTLGTDSFELSIGATGLTAPALPEEV